MNSSSLPQSMHQYTQFLLPVLNLVKNFEVNPLQCKLPGPSLTSDYTGKHIQPNFLAATTRCRISVFPNLCPNGCISWFSTMLIEILISRHYVLKKRTSKWLKISHLRGNQRFQVARYLLSGDFPHKISSVRQIVKILPLDNVEFVKESSRPILE